MGYDNNFYSTAYSTVTNFHIYKCTRSKFPKITNFFQTVYPTYIKTKNLLYNLCPCNKPTTTQSQSNFHCQCLNKEVYPTYWLNLQKSESTELTEVLKHSFNQYDVVTNMALRSANENESPGDSSLLYYTSDFNTDIEEYPTKTIFQKKSKENDNSQKNINDYITINKQQKSEQNYNFYDFYVPRQKQKRENIEQITLKPFWQFDQFSNLDLKSMRYTTLANKKNKKTRRTSTSIKPSLFTEVITLKLKDLSSIKYERDLVSEKYLSFDELMHIRKMSTSEIKPNGRRKFSETNILRDDKTTTSVTTIATIETPFARKKHCTRKLTCTWTAFTETGSDGKIILPGAYGSKTPPGYVDGCTRTSTCTRDFQERNKISTIPDFTSIEPSPEDVDYCEKRSLNVDRRNTSNEIIKDGFVFGILDTHRSTRLYDIQEYDYSRYETTPIGKINCDCDHERLRRKREAIDYCNCITNMSNTVSYGNLYYMIIRSIIKSRENENYLYNLNKCSFGITDRNMLPACTLFLIINYI